MKLSTLAVAAPLLASTTSAFPASHFTITALGNLVPSGYTGYKYSVRFLIRDTLNAVSLTRCHFDWRQKTNFPDSYIPCDDPTWTWHYNGPYKECGFSLSLAHSKIERDGTVKTNTTSFASVLPSQVPCGVGASRNFTCIYGASGAQLCGLGEGTILQIPVRSKTVKQTKVKRSARRAVLFDDDREEEFLAEWEEFEEGQEAEGGGAQTRLVGDV
ncbi:Carboxypeptidase Y [Sphaceloma murrayae]|uniref:Carboxypeptidase Y n=1 Tax=Sphaceloma murrayae TaxID=2082308 RepID=A0A2K1QUG1_9PEZI|nr:Carboxypeptidase Y [Sphaceloma murrayae]